LTVETPSIPFVRIVGFALVSVALALACKSETKSPKPGPVAAAPTNDGTEAVAEGPAPNAAPEPAPLPAPRDLESAPSDAVRTPSGLASKVLAAGDGKTRPSVTDHVHVRFTGWKKDGTMFDSTEQGSPPRTLDLGRAIPGFREALPQMVVHEKRRLWLPEKLAYGARATRAGQPRGDLVFDLELVAIVDVPEIPKDLAKPPSDAKKTPSGLAYEVLRPGSGTEHPTPESRVTVQYSGWTKDGQPFDSTFATGAPANLSLRQTIRGFSEGLPLMVVGEKTRFWIPAPLAYGNQSGHPRAPAGDLVYDVELLAIQPHPE
jgi:peptidylprolyl isomerase